MQVEIMLKNEMMLLIHLFVQIEYELLELEICVSFVYLR